MTKLNFIKRLGIYMLIIGFVVSVPLSDSFARRSTASFKQDMDRLGGFINNHFNTIDRTVEGAGFAVGG